MQKPATFTAYDISPVDELEEEQRRAEKMQMFGNNLHRKADEQVRLKQEIEQRWVDDLRHYNGRYDRDTEAKLATNKEKKSTVFVNLTRAKANLAESKLSDMILPTDDRNWGIKPTPVPELADLHDNHSPVMLNTGQVATKPDSDEPYTYADLNKITMEEAKKRASAMQAEIDDQLKESKYNSVCRDVIHNGVVMGTGILKGPNVMKRMRKSWTQVNGSDQYMLAIRESHEPGVSSVDPWNFFPDMSATCWDDVEFIFERHLLTPKQVRDLLKRPGFMKPQIREVLKQGPKFNGAWMSYLNELREINGITQITYDNRYEVWEYHGPIDKENLIACGCEGIDSDDPLEEYEGTVWFCNDIVLKVSLNPMDDDSRPYSVFCWEDDDTSVFGFGVPYRMRSSQRVMNGSWRMLLDNAGLSTGPQIVVNRKVVEPADGDWELSPRKIWYLKDAKYRVTDAFATHEINSHQAELTAIFEMAHTLAEEETSLPQLGAQIAQENQPAAMKTLGGTALWMSSQNITMRRAVKNWDDNITIPFITRTYYWNMQFNPKPDIKGDFEVDARGTSVLLVKEMQARNLVEFANIVFTYPGFLEKVNDDTFLREIAKAMQLDDSILKAKEEVDADQEKQGQGPPDPETMKLQMQERIAQYSLQEKQIESEVMMQKAMIEREIDLTKLAVEERRSLQDIQKEYNLEGLRVEWDREKFYKEISIKQQQGQEANYGLGE